MILTIHFYSVWAEVTRSLAHTIENRARLSQTTSPVLVLLVVIQQPVILLMRFH